MHFQIICFCVLQNKESLLQVWNDMSASFHGGDLGVSFHGWTILYL